MIYLGNKNKKGDIPILILVIGVFGVSALALLTFFVSDYNVGNSFVGVGIMEKMNADIDSYLFYRDIGVPQSSLDLMYDYVERDSQKYFYEEKTSSPFNLFDSERKVLLFSVEYPVPN